MNYLRKFSCSSQTFALRPYALPFGRNDKKVFPFSFAMRSFFHDSATSGGEITPSRHKK